MNAYQITLLCPHTYKQKPVTVQVSADNPFKAGQFARNKASQNTQFRVAASAFDLRDCQRVWAQS